MKIQSYDVHQLPQEAIDYLEDIKTLLNYGKYQFQVLLGVPTFQGRQGEVVLVYLGGTGKLYWCTSDNSNSWATLS